MSGHSKWATTKRKKESIDAKRSASFTKLANIITVAAREGGDAEMNFKLRMAIDKAKTASMPKENIDRAIKRGTGELEGGQIEEMIYEGFGPEGTAFVMEVVTDNKNRASSEIKHILASHGGNLAGPGATLWMFDRKGVLTIEGRLDEEKQLEMIDAGADDLQTEDDETIIYSAVEAFQAVKQKAENLGLSVIQAELQYIAKDLIKPSNEDKIINLYEALDACDDVSNFYANADI